MLHKRLAEPSASEAEWRERYFEACLARRSSRMAPYRDKIRRIVLAQHTKMGGSHYAYTDALSIGEGEFNFRSGGSLSLLELAQDGVLFNNQGPK